MLAPTSVKLALFTHQHETLLSLPSSHYLDGSIACPFEAKQPAASDLPDTKNFLLFMKPVKLLLKSTQLADRSWLNCSQAECVSQRIVHTLGDSTMQALKQICCVCWFIDCRRTHSQHLAVKNNLNKTPQQLVLLLLVVAFAVCFLFSTCLTV